jgi:glycerol uptake facilitator-like aquaporin
LDGRGVDRRITSAYWFTASTSFANPAITIARSLSNTFSGIRPADVPGFIVAQIAGALLALLVARRLFQTDLAMSIERAATDPSVVGSPQGLESRGDRS